MTDSTAAKHFADVLNADLVADFDFAAHEHEAFAVSVDCTALYGADIRWMPVTLKAGSYVVENGTMGGDPAPGTYKGLYVPKGSFVVAAPPPAAPAAPSPVAAPSPPAPAPAAPVSVATLTREALEARLGVHYGLRTSDISEAELTALPQSFPDGSLGNLSLDQTQTGAQNDIGFAPDFAARYVITMDPRALGNLKANVHCLKQLPYHCREKDGRPARPWMFPNAGNQDFGPDVTANPNARTDEQHQDHAAYVYAVVTQMTGDQAEFQFALDELKFRVGFDFFTTDSSRTPDGYFNPQNSIVGLRGGGWSVLAAFQLFDVLPKDDEWYPWVKKCCETNLIRLRNTYIPTDGTWINESGGLQPDGSWGGPNGVGWATNELGLYLGGQWNPDADTYKAGDPTHYRAFMQAFMCTGVLWACKKAPTMDLSDEAKRAAVAHITFAGGWVTGIHGAPNDPNSFDYRYGALYDIYGGIVRADQGADWPKGPGKWGKLGQANYGQRPALGPDDHLFRDHDNTSIMGTISDGYEGDVLPALSFAVELKVPGAADSLARVKSTRQYKQKDCALQFCILPFGDYSLSAVTDPTSSPVPVTTPTTDPVKPTAPVETPTPVETAPTVTSAGYESTTEFLPEPPMPATVWGTPVPYNGFRRTVAHPTGFSPLVNGPRKATGAVAGSVVTIPGTALTNFVSPDQAGEVIAHLLSIWSGMAWSGKSRRFGVGPMGGHGGGNQSIVLGIDGDALVGHLFYKGPPVVTHVPDPNSPDLMPGPEYAQAVHQYDADCFVIDPLDGKEKLFFVGAGTCFLYDSDANTIEQLQPVPQGGGEGMTDFNTAFDQTRSCIWAQTHGQATQLKRFDLASRRWYQHGDIGNPDSYNYRTGFMLNPIEDELLLLVGAPRNVYPGFVGPIVRFARLSLKTLQLIAPWREIPFMVPDNYSLCFDPIAKDFVVFASDPSNGAQGRYWAMDRLTGAMTDLAAGGNPPDGNQNGNNIGYDDQRDEFLVVTELDADLTTFKRRR